VKRNLPVGPKEKKRNKKLSEKFYPDVQEKEHSLANARLKIKVAQGTWVHHDSRLLTAKLL